VKSSAIYTPNAYEVILQGSENGRVVTIAKIVCDIVRKRKYKLPSSNQSILYRICTLRHIRIEIIHGSQNVFLVLTWVGGY